MAEKKQSPLDAVKDIDLDELNRQIEEKESELTEIVTTRRAEIDGLKMLAKIVDVMRNGKRKIERKAKAAKPRGTAVSTGQPTIADRAVTYLEAAGSATAAAITRGLSLSNQSTIYGVLANDSRFKKGADGMYSLAR